MYGFAACARVCIQSVPTARVHVVHVDDLKPVNSAYWKSCHSRHTSIVADGILKGGEAKYICMNESIPTVCSRVGHLALALKLLR